MKKLRKLLTSRYSIPLLFLLLAALCFVCWRSKQLLDLRPFQEEVTFSGPSAVFGGESGRTYVVDDGKRAVCVLSPEGELEFTLKGGSRADGSFYFASTVCEGNDGRIYIADNVYSGEGTRISKERIIRYEADGTGGVTVYEINYSDKDYPMQYSRIKYLAVNGNRILYSMANGTHMGIYMYDIGSGSSQEKTYDLEDKYVFDMTLDPETYLPVWVTKTGEVYAVNNHGTVDRLYNKGGVPYQVSASPDGYIYFSEAESGAMLRCDYDGFVELVTGEFYSYYMDAASGRLVGSDGTGVYSWSEEEGASYFDTVPVANTGLRTFVWALAALAALVALVTLICAAILLVSRWKESLMLRRIVLVLVLAVCVSSVAAYYIISRSFTAQEQKTAEQLNGFLAEMTALVDAEALKEIDSLDDYRTEPFMKNRDRLSEPTAQTYIDGRCFYYVIYRTDGETIYAVMDYEDTVQAWMPYYTYEDGGGYTECFETKSDVVVEREVSMWGAWTYILGPLLDESGEIVGIIDVGASLDSIQERKSATFKETLLSILFVTIVLVMAAVEVIFYLEQRRKVRKLDSGSLDVVETVPLRMILFIVFTVDCMQDAFVSVLAGNLYQGFLGIPASVGAALPISMQVLSAALFAVVGGNIIRYLGTRTTMTVGFAVQMAGFLICAMLETYFGLVIGKILAGAGLSLIAVSANSVAASTHDETVSRRAFAGITAGTLGGVSAGAGLGSIVLSFGSYRLVFIVGAAVLVLGLLLALRCHDVRMSGGAEEQEATKNGKSGIVAFVLDRRVLLFLALALLPFMMAISFREYFFPIYAAEHGMSETNIGRIYVLCGLLTMYMGPILSELLMERLGSKMTLIAAAALMAIATMLFGFMPDMATAITGVVLLSLSTSFGYVSQSTYFSSLPMVRSYGESRAMGVYSLFDNGGQTLGPVVYGFALLLGYQSGLLLVGEALMVITIIFSVGTVQGGRRKRQKDKPEVSADA